MVGRAWSFWWGRRRRRRALVVGTSTAVVAARWLPGQRLVNDRTTVIGARTRQGPQSICRGPSPAPGVPAHSVTRLFTIPTYSRHFRGGSQKRFRSIPTTTLSAYTYAQTHLSLTLIFFFFLPLFSSLSLSLSLCLQLPLFLYTHLCIIYVYNIRCVTVTRLRCVKRSLLHPTLCSHCHPNPELYTDNAS